MCFYVSHFFLDIISFYSLFDSLSSQVSLCRLYICGATRNRINPDRRVVLVELSASTKPVSWIRQDGISSWSICVSLHIFFVILYQICGDYTRTVWAVSCVAVPLLYNTCDAKSLRIWRDSLVQFGPKHIHFYVSYRYSFLCFHVEERNFNSPKVFKPWSNFLSKSRSSVIQKIFS